MIFLANVERKEFGRNAKEKELFRIDGDKLRKLLRRYRQEPNGTYIIQRKETLKRDLERFGAKKCAVSLFLTGYITGNGSLRCYFANSKFRSRNSTISITELTKILQGSGAIAAYVFIAVSEKLNNTISKDIFSINDNLCYCIISNQWERLGLLLSSEVDSWVGVTSLDNRPITYRKIGQILEKLIYHLSGMIDGLDINKTIQIINNVSSEVVAWEPKCNQEIGVNKDKLQFGRTEQVLDELNRLAQVASDRDFSPQASFWFTELEEKVIAKYPQLPYRLLIYGEALGNKAGTFTYATQITKKFDPGLEKLITFINKFVTIPSGYFVMGKNADKGASEPPCTPEHKVWLMEYRIMDAPLTQADWKLFTQDEKSSLPGRENHPVNMISFLEAMEIAEHITNILHKYDLLDTRSLVSLPNEAQWEKAARGTEGKEYPWGDNFLENLCNIASSGIGDTTPIGSFSPIGDSPYGCKDMVGNVREWTRSFGGNSIRSHNLYPYNPETDIDLSSMRPELQMIVRGGSFSYDDDCTMVWVRNKEVAGQKRKDTGFRYVIVKHG